MCVRRGVVHRDLKLENLLLATPNDIHKVKIADFGLAKKAAESAMATICGTPQYVAPEVIQVLVCPSVCPSVSLSLCLSVLWYPGHPLRAWSQKLEAASRHAGTDSSLTDYKQHMNTGKVRTEQHGNQPELCVLDSLITT